MPDELMRLPAPSQAQTVAELERELRMRATVFPLMIFKKTLRPHEAEHRNACLRKALADLRDYYEGAADGR